MIVDLLRNDLGKVAVTGSVGVPQLFAVERYPTVLQMTSTIEAECRSDARLLDILKGARRPLILLVKGAAYAQADADIRALVEKTGIPYLPMSMAKGLLPDTHAQSASAARSYVLQEADVVVLIGARLNWLLSHGKGKTWAQEKGAKRFIQIDIAPTEIDSNVAIEAPVIGDIGSCVAALLAGIDAKWARPPAEWTGAIAERKDKNLSKMAATLAARPSPMNFHSALSVIRDQVKARPDAIVVNEGANTLDFARSIVDMYEPRKRLDVGTWGIMGIGMGFSVAAAVVTGKPVIAIEGDSAFGFSGMEVETICRYNLPVCVIVFNNNGVYRGTDVNPSGTPDVAPTVFVKNARYDKLMEAFGGVGVHATTAQELEKGLTEAVASGRPTLINAVIDETAGTESGRITRNNPGAAKKNKSQAIQEPSHEQQQTPRRHQDHRLHPCPGRACLHADAGLVRRRRDQGRAPGRRRRHAHATA